MKTGVEQIAEERQIKQIEKHGFTGEHHADHPEWYDEGQLIHAARWMLEKNRFGNPGGTPKNWNEEWWSDLCTRPYQDRLVMAGAFIAAEIDRLNVLKQRENGSQEGK